MITIDEFSKIEMRVGLVVGASIVEGSEKLIRLEVDFGEEKRIIFTGVRKWYEPDYFTGRKFVFVTNLEPRKMMGEESQGMIMAAEGSEGTPIFVAPIEAVEPGSKIR
jgi:methionine--tRNA ligase beta chain